MGAKLGNASKYKNISSSSPLFGIAIQEDILIRKGDSSALAELLNNTWATLEDGTPLITANMMDKVKYFFSYYC